MPKIDLTKKYKEYYTAKTSPQLIELSKANFLTIEGKGEPAGKQFTQAVQALYPLAYEIKNLSKKEGCDFAVAKLEGLWWVESNKTALEVPRKQWCWKLLIRLPDFIYSELVAKAKEEVIKNRGIELVKEIKFEKITEGKCIQILHIGPYSTEPETIGKMRKMMKENNLIENGLHHEIYLSDPRKTPPQKMKTILRQPVRKYETNKNHKKFLA